MVEVKSLSMNYGKTQALIDVSFTAYKGQILGLLGPNGAGKTTLMRILTSYLYPAKGTALIDGHDVTKEPLVVRSLIGYMPETVPLYDDMVVDEYLIFIGKARGLFGSRLRNRLRWVKENCGIGSIWKHIISEISKGFRQRVGLAQALIHDPQILILDEPMAGLDPLQIIGIRKLIRQLTAEKTIIFSTHILQEVEALADRIVILNNGRLIASGTRDEITRQSSDIQRIQVSVRAKQQDVRTALEKDLSPDVEIQFEGLGEDDYSRFLVSAKFDQDLITKVKEIIEKKGWFIKEIATRKVSLEESFIYLLSRDATEQEQNTGVGYA